MTLLSPPLLEGGRNWWRKWTRGVVVRRESPAVVVGEVM